MLVCMAAVVGFLTTSIASAYEEGESGEGVVEGKITFKGTPPRPSVRPFFKDIEVSPGRFMKNDFFPNAKYCSQFDNDGKGNRVLNRVNVKNDRLQDVVVYIQSINKGKPFTFDGTDVKVNGCRFLVQGGPSTWVGVVVNGREIRIVNEDADLSDPRA